MPLFFAEALAQSLADLASNEWAVDEASARATRGLSPHAAFGLVVEVLHLAALQDDRYAFSECCWLAHSLAELSDTTEQPPGLTAALEVLAPVADKLGAVEELNVVSAWYRLSRLPVSPMGPFSS